MPGPASLGFSISMMGRGRVETNFREAICVGSWDARTKGQGGFQGSWT